MSNKVAVHVQNFIQAVLPSGNFHMKDDGSSIHIIINVF